MLCSFACGSLCRCGSTIARLGPGLSCGCRCQPTARGLRYPVATLLELLASGMTTEEIIEDHPDLESHGVLAVLDFGALASGMRDR